MDFVQERSGGGGTGTGTTTDVREHEGAANGGGRIGGIYRGCREAMSMSNEREGVTLCGGGGTRAYLRESESSSSREGMTTGAKGNETGR